jgi:hypothetical protein
VAAPQVVFGGGSDDGEAAAAAAVAGTSSLTSALEASTRAAVRSAVRAAAAGGTGELRAAAAVADAASSGRHADAAAAAAAAAAERWLAARRELWASMHDPVNAFGSSVAERRAALAEEVLFGLFDSYATLPVFWAHTGQFTADERTHTRMPDALKFDGSAVNRWPGTEGRGRGQQQRQRRPHSSRL